MAETTAGTILTAGDRSRIAARVGALAGVAFGLWLLLALTTSSWRYGPFSWWPLWQEEQLAGAPVALGLLNLLPLVAIAGWLVRRLLGRDSRWTCGPPATTLPFLALSLLGLLTLEPLPGRLTFISISSLLLTWFVYLAVLNEQPPLFWILAAVVLVQSAVGLGQFLLQRDLGLALLGELWLRPWWEGTSVLSARGQPWLRAYGLVAHPNLLGAILTVSVLFLLPGSGLKGESIVATRPPLRRLLFAMGLLGLLVTFSRAAWLASTAGLLLALWSRRHHTTGRFPTVQPRRWLWLLLPPILFLLLYHDLVVSRLLALDTPLEAQSIADRLRDTRLALDVIARSPWRGVGLGRYLDVATLLDPAAARVHNATLLITAELGLPGLLLWLLLALAPFWLVWRGRLDPAGLPPWLAMLIINLFDTTLWWSSNWQTAILFGLLLAGVSRPPAPDQTVGE